ncbi:ABC transporter ATP-binding protein [Halobium palmae]|uniref:Molybdate/tungstate import ATP-binding protein WtpC n=1 Tax=Halobium palmae TaxID=1776492 RepID=A0ABD5RWK4_9EURY
MSAIELHSLTKRFGELTAVDDLSLEVKEGELLCLLGPSGCGKSTTMRMIGGLERPTEGKVSINGEEVTRTPAYERDSSIVFQNWALFPHKTVLENVEFGLKMDGVSDAERTERAREMLEMVQLSDYEDSSPNELSGGQQQRVALARSLIVEPHVLMLDEPLSNLDKRLKEEMQLELKEIHDDLDQTMVYVTHDQNEAFTLADRIGVMNDGQIVQVGEPPEVYNNPKTQFVEEFLGDTNIVSGQVEETTENSVLANSELGCSFEIPVKRDSVPEIGEPITVSLRPENMTVKPSQSREITADGGKPRSRVAGEITNVIYRGSMVRSYVDTGSREVFVEQQYDPDAGVWGQDNAIIEWNSDRLVAFDDDGMQITPYEAQL